MGSRSNVSLVGNTTYGVNLGGGASIYNGKAGGNVLQFKTIKATGSSIQIITGGTMIYISGGTSGGGIGTITGGTNGLSTNGTNVTLGGTLIGTTTIQLDSNVLDFLNTASGFDVCFDSTLNDVINLGSGGGAYIDINGATDCVDMQVSTTGVGVCIQGDAAQRITLGKLDYSEAYAEISTGGVDIIDLMTLGGANVYIDGATPTVSITDATNNITLNSGGVCITGTIFNASTTTGSPANNIVVRANTGELKTVTFAAVTGSSVATASNGLTKTGQNVTLGGTLSQSTCVLNSGTANCLVLGGADATCAFGGPDANAKLYIGTNCGAGQDAQNKVVSSAKSALGCAAHYVTTTGITSMECSGGLLRTTLLGTNAMVYGGDYSSCFVARSIPDVGYVTGLTSTLGIQTVNNGLTKVGTNAVLGGALTGDTNISMGTNSLSINGTGTYINFSGTGPYIEMNSCSAQLILNGNACAIEMTLGGYSAFRIYTGETVYQSTVGGGIAYFQDYSSTYNPRSLVDCEYVNILVSGSTGAISSANNGLNVAGTNVRLGGILTGNTAIDLSSYSLIFENGSVISSGVTSQGFDTYNDYKISGNTFLYVPSRNIANGNLALGYNVGNNTLTGVDNTGIGHQILYSLTTGSHNFGAGCYTLASNTCGSCNIGIGNQVLRYGSCGCDNIAIGNNALQNTCGCSNVGLGNQVLVNNTTGSDNIAIGCKAMFSNASGINNTALGFWTLYCNTTGRFNVAMGGSALYCNTTGWDNISISRLGLFNNTDGCQNMAIGYRPLFYNTTGCNNIAIGLETMCCNITGKNNIAIGCWSLALNQAGNDNVSMGDCAGFTTCGSSNVYLGRQAGYSTTGSSKLYIANCSTCSLIYGEFDNKLVKIDCTLQVCKDLQSLTNGGGVILCSPDGTKYCLTVANCGTLSIAEVCI